MKKMHTLKYFINILTFLLCVVFTYAQEQDTDTIPKQTQKYGLRVGADLYRATKPFYTKNYTGFEVVGDYRITKSHYIAAEFGHENKTTDDDRVNFTTRGSYLKVGFDYNAYENWLDMQNMIYVGLRYGVSNFNQTLNTYTIYNTTNYFPENHVTSGLQYNNLNSQWIEFVAGVKAEIFSNLFLGFSLRINRFISNKKPENFDNLYIPGFNRTYNGDFGAGFNYTISYLIPAYKK